MEHVFVKSAEGWDEKTLERKLFILRKFSVHNVHTTFPQTQEFFYIASFSYKTIVYKGQLTTFQVRPYFPDLQDDRLTSAIAIVHSRFSTNTVPQWRLAQPFRYMCFSTIKVGYHADFNSRYIFFRNITISNFFFTAN